jgi:hypothetical protein
MVGTERTFKRAGSIAKFTKPVCDEPQPLPLFQGRAEFWNGNSEIYYIVTRFNSSAGNPRKQWGPRSAVVHLPIAFALKAELQDPVFGIVALAAARAYEKGPEMSPFAIVILSDGKSCSTTAGNQEH